MIRGADCIEDLAAVRFLYFFRPHAQDSVSIEGSVVDRVTRIGISGVFVYFGSELSPNYDAVTDDSGKFQIVGMKAGQYGSHFQKAGYVPLYSGTGDSTLKPVRVAAGQDTVRLRIELAAFAKVSGRVLDPEGKPVANATVSLPNHTETTDEQGQFAFTDLAARLVHDNGHPRRGFSRPHGSDSRRGSH